MNALMMIKSAFGALGKNKFRTFLTMLGIIIGVAAVIVMQGIGRGTEAVVNNRIASLGTNLIFVIPSAARENGVRQTAGTQQSLTVDDVEAIRKFCPDVQYVSPLISKSVQIKFSANNWQTTILGVSSDFLRIRDMTVLDGASFNSEDIKTSAKYCLLGNTVKNELFTNNENPVGKTIRVGLIPFKVIGVLAPKGQTGFGRDQDDIILAPYTSVKNRITGSRYIQQIYVSARSLNDINPAVSEITRTLRIQHRIAEGQADDFTINTQSEIAQTAQSITGALTTLLASIAAISLLVGGIGIMNIMLVSVTERTREIGIRLAIGATAYDILTQLLIEAVVLSITAGLIGVLFGVAVATALSRFVGWETVITPGTELAAFLISSFIGVFFGWYPARKAARLNPIDALRFE
jgi:putative ABC transport system permease protein